MKIFRHEKPARSSAWSAALPIACALLAVWACSPDRTPDPVDISALPTKPETAFEGRIVFQSNMEGTNAVYVMSPEGIRRLTQTAWDSQFPVWSPDGDRIAFFANPEGPYNIHVMNADGSDPIRVTASGLDDKDPAWFPDGRHLAFARERKRLVGRNIELFKLDLETGNTERLLPDFPDTHGIPHVSPVDRRIVFTGKRAMGWDAGVYNFETGEITYLGELGQTCRARFSPDGSRLAYVSSEADGKGDIWICNKDGSGKTRLTLRDDTYDYFPSWSPDGRFIVFSSSTRHDMNADWTLHIINVETLETHRLIGTPGSHVFPDWTK
jgi:Tol biopolymer transport system component